MKNRIFTLLVSMFCFFTVEAQYSISVESTTYAELPAEATKMATDTSLTILDLPFETKIGKELIKKLEFSYAAEFWGFAGFAEDGQAERQFVIPFNSFSTIYYSEIKDYADAGIYYLTEGDAGDRIFKMEWRNIPTLAESETKFSFQAWLHEKDNAITFLMGDVVNPVDSLVTTTTLIGILNNLSEVSIGQESFLLTGDPQNPTMETGISYQNPPTGLQTAPASGTMYKINYKSSSSTKAFPNYSGKINVFPNPAKEKIAVSLEDQSSKIRSVRIVDMHGRSYNRVINNFENIDISRLSKGYYIVEIDTNKGVSYQKLSVL